MSKPTNSSFEKQAQDKSASSHTPEKRESSAANARLLHDLRQHVSQQETELKQLQDLEHYIAIQEQQARQNMALSKERKTLNEIDKKAQQTEVFFENVYLSVPAPATIDCSPTATPSLTPADVQQQTICVEYSLASSVTKPDSLIIGFGQGYGEEQGNKVQAEAFALMKQIIANERAKAEDSLQGTKDNLTKAEAEGTQDDSSKSKEQTIS